MYLAVTSYSDSSSTYIQQYRWIFPHIKSLNCHDLETHSADIAMHDVSYRSRLSKATQSKRLLRGSDTLTRVLRVQLWKVEFYLKNPTQEAAEAVTWAIESYLIQKLTLERT